MGKLAKYIESITLFIENTKNPEDLKALNLLKDHASKLLTEPGRSISLKNEINAHERLLGQIWLSENKTHEVLYEKWNEFKKTSSLYGYIMFYLQKISKNFQQNTQIITQKKSGDTIHHNMTKKIIELSETKLNRKLANSEKQNILKDRSGFALEIIVDYIEGTEFKEGELERYLTTL